MQKLLTIIVPVYKVEQYINKCLDSCVLDDEKLMNLLEVIVVNDGTPDNSAEMSRVYVKRYPNTFRQIDKENGGHGSAWNVGLKEATGKYIRFLDSDDWLTNLDVLMAKLQETDADLVFTQMVKYHAQNNEYEQVRIQGEDGVCKELQQFDFISNNEMHLLDFWHTTYKATVLQYGVDLFLEHTMYDDGILFVLPAIKGKTYVLYDNVLYNYFIGREGQSLGQELKPKNVRARYRQCVYMWDFWNQYGGKVDETITAAMKSIMSRFAAYIFADFVQLPYSECKEYSAQCAKYIDIFPNQKQGKVYNRYRSLPFFAYYLIERIRNSSVYKHIRK